MNRHQDAIQNAIARLGDHVGRVQLLMRNLADCRELSDGAIDPETGETVPLFHPVRQRWGEHFRWSEDGCRILGQTPEGRPRPSPLGGS